MAAQQQLQQPEQRANLTPLQRQMVKSMLDGSLDVIPKKYKASLQIFFNQLDTDKSGYPYTIVFATS